MATSIFGRIMAAVMATAIALTSLPATAQQRGRSVALVRDGEAESLIRDYARPILKAAGLGGATIKIRIVNDTRFNAFVADGRHIFVNAGTISQTETPNELIGVIAHETGHLAGGHLARLRDAVVQSQILSVIAMLGGAAAAAAGGGGEGGMAAALGGQQVAQRSLLSYQRGEETAADRAALTYLERTGQSAQGMLSVFKRLGDQQLFAARFADPYAQSHPMAAERLSQVENVARKSKFFDKADPADLQARHDLIRAKFIAFTQAPQKTARMYPPNATDLPSRYAHAVIAFRSGNPQAAVRQIDGLIAAQPRNPWFWELKGQALLEGGRPAEAVEPLRQAVALAPNEGQLRVMLGHALVATEKDSLLAEAIQNLNKGLADDPDAAIGYRQLAIAHARSGNIALADLATAQGYFAAGDNPSARQYAARAQANLKRGTPAWLRADDIISFKPPRL